MNILKIGMYIPVVVSIFLPQLQAKESNSSFFIGSSVNFSSFKDGDGGGGPSISSEGIDIRAGYQFGDYLKLTVGYGAARLGAGELNGAGSNISPLFARIRPQWIFENGFLVYVEAGILTTSEGEGAMAGFGLGYTRGQHEISVGYEDTQVDDEFSVTALSFQYYFHF